MPQNQAAFFPEAGAKALQVGNAPYHPPGPGEIVIKNHAVAVNPVDWKMQDHGLFLESYPTIFGCDVAGTVEAIGHSVVEFQPGDRVIGQALCLSLGPKYAAFQSFVPCPVIAACKIPDELSYTQGCVLPLSVNTASLGLFTPETLNLPAPSVNPPASNKIILIYGGSTSVGSSAIQLAKAAGATVVVTASAANHDYCIKLGADYVIDYRQPQWPAKAAAVLQDQGKEFVGVYDAIGEDSIFRTLSQMLSSMSSQAPIASVGTPPAGVKANMVFGANIVFDDALAKAVWRDFLPHALANGSFVSKPDALEIGGGGLGGIQAAMDAQRKGVSARKVVVRIL